MFKMFSKTAKQRKLEKQVLQLEAQLEKDVEILKRIIDIKDAELQAMAAVVARDRARVAAEAAAYLRARAESEGSNVK